jgi:hypothetical protein
VALEIGCMDVDWFDLFQDKNKWLGAVNMGINFWVAWDVGNFLIRYGSIGFSRRTLLYAVLGMSGLQVLPGVTQMMCC